MVTTGIVRRVDDLGRVVSPKEIRRRLGITEGQPLELYLDGDSIVYKKYDLYDTPISVIKNAMHVIENDDNLDPALRRALVLRLKETAALIKPEDLM